MTSSPLPQNSYVARFTGLTPLTTEVIVETSHWQPGYTDAYKATPEEALEFRFAQQRHAMELAEARKDAVIKKLVELEEAARAEMGLSR